jgi:hypothetical protein
MKLTDKFAMFILTHGRPHEVLTMQALKDSNYTGKTYIIIDNEDKQGDEYRKVFGEEMVIEFDKAAIGKTFDIADTRTDRRATVYARNASFQIAKDLGLDYFMQLDDDYTNFLYRFDQDNKLKGRTSKSLDQVVDAFINLLEDTNAVTVAMAQGGDFIGGVVRFRKDPLMRKAMNSWLFRTDRPLTFVGRMNDDVNTYVMNGMRGELILTPRNFCLFVAQTQELSGGMTEMYVENGTYMKSFYTVMMNPAAVKVAYMGAYHPRLHHMYQWDYLVPKIINERHRKPYADTTTLP